MLGAAQQPLPQGRRHSAHPPVEHPFPGPGLLDPRRRLVRLQRDERADARQDLRPRRRQLADGHGRRRWSRRCCGKNDPGFVHNGALAGLIAVCAGTDIMHPLGALVTGGIAGAIFVSISTLTQNAEDRRRARRLAAARPVRRLGRHRRRHLRQRGAGRPRRRDPRRPAHRHRRWASPWPSPAAWPSTASCARPWACAFPRKTSSTAPTCPSTRSAPRRTAKRAGRAGGIVGVEETAWPRRSFVEEVKKLRLAQGRGVPRRRHPRRHQGAARIRRVVRGRLPGRADLAPDGRAGRRAGHPGRARHPLREHAPARRPRRRRSPPRSTTRCAAPSRSRGRSASTSPPTRSPTSPRAASPAAPSSSSARTTAKARRSCRSAATRSR